MSPYEAVEAKHIQEVATRVLSKAKASRDETELAAFAASVLQHYDRGELEMERCRNEAAAANQLRIEARQAQRELSQLRSLVSSIGKVLERAVYPLVEAEPWEL